MSNDTKGGVVSYKLKNKVFIVSARKTDGRYNSGIIVGVKSAYPYLTVLTFSDFKRGLILSEYQVAYEDVFTKKCCLEWFHERDLSKELKKL